MTTDNDHQTAASPSPALTSPLARYVHSCWVGDLLFVAGQGCRDPETGLEVGILSDASASVSKIYDIDAQTRGVFSNIERVLAKEGLTKEHLVDVTVFLCDMDDFAAMNAVWNEFFATVATPCRTTVAVRQLPGKNFVEMKAIAARSSDMKKK